MTFSPKPIVALAVAGVSIVGLVTIATPAVAAPPTQPWQKSVETAAGSGQYAVTRGDLGTSVPVGAAPGIGAWYQQNGTGVSWRVAPYSSLSDTAPAPAADGNVTGTYTGPGSLLVNGVTSTQADVDVASWNATLLAPDQNLDTWLTPDQVDTTVTGFDGTTQRVFEEDVNGYMQNHGADALGNFAGPQVQDFVSTRFGGGHSVLPKAGNAPGMNTDFVQKAKDNAGTPGGNVVDHIAWSYYPSGGPQDIGSLLEIMPGVGAKPSVAYVRAFNAQGNPIPGAVLQMTTNSDTVWTTDTTSHYGLSAQDFLRPATAWSTKPAGTNPTYTFVANDDGMIAVPLNSFSLQQLANAAGQFDAAIQFDNIIELSAPAQCSIGTSWKDSDGTQSFGVSRPTCAGTTAFSLGITVPKVLTDTPVIPVQPTATGDGMCGSGSPFDDAALDSDPAITYTATQTGPGAWTVVATAKPGYTIDPAAVASWDYTFPTVTCVTPQPPTVTPPATCDTTGSVNLPSTTGVTYTRTNHPDGTVTVTAEAAPGYRVQDGVPSSWTLDPTKGKTVCATPAAPKLVPAASCGQEATIDVPTVTGVSYTQNRVGQDVTVTATAAAGYQVAAGAETTWTLTIPDVVACDTDVTPVAPTLNTPACGEEATVELPEVNGVSYAQTRSGSTVTVTATANAGYSLAAGAQDTWTLDIPAVKPCDVPVTAAAPTLSTPPCGEAAIAVLPTVPGVTYMQWTTGNTINVVATPDSGYVFADGNGQETWTLTIPDVVACATDVTPVAPTLNTPACGEEATVELPEVNGVSYAQTRSGSTVTVTATANAGYSLAAGAQDTWTLDIPAVKPCDVPVTAAAPTLSTPPCGEAATVNIPTIPGAVYDKSVSGSTVTVTATPATGYAFPADAQTVWTLDIPAVKPCPLALDTNALKSVLRGKAMTDIAHVTGAVPAGAYLLFDVYAYEGQASRPSAPLFQGTVKVPVTGPGDYTSPVYTATDAAEYQWFATLYGADDTVLALDTWGVASERTTVTEPTPSATPSESPTPSDSSTTAPTHSSTTAPTHSAPTGGSLWGGIATAALGALLLAAAGVGFAVRRRA